MHQVSMQLKCKHFEESYKSIKPLKQQNFVKYKNIKIRSEIILAARQTFEPFDDDFFAVMLRLHI